MCHLNMAPRIVGPWLRMVFNTKDYSLYASSNTSVSICTHQSGCECTDHKEGLLIIFPSLFSLCISIMTI
jgi:hypothetical protein